MTALGYYLLLWRWGKLTFPIQIDATESMNSSIEETVLEHLMKVDRESILKRAFAAVLTYFVTFVPIGMGAASPGASKYFVGFAEIYLLNLPLYFGVSFLLCFFKDESLKLTGVFLLHACLAISLLPLVALLVMIPVAFVAKILG